MNCSIHFLSGKIYQNISIEKSNYINKNNINNIFKQIKIPPRKYFCIINKTDIIYCNLYQIDITNDIYIDTLYILFVNIPHEIILNIEFLDYSFFNSKEHILNKLKPKIYNDLIENEIFITYFFRDKYINLHTIRKSIICDIISLYNNNYDIMLLLCINLPSRMICKCSDSLLNNINFYIDIISKNKRCLKYSPKYILQNKIVIRSIENNKDTLRYFSTMNLNYNIINCLKNNKEFIKLAYNNSKNKFIIDRYIYNIYNTLKS